MSEPAPSATTALDRVLAVVFEGMTSIDEEKLELGLTYCDDISPTDILEALGYEAPYVDLVIPWSRARR